MWWLHHIVTVLKATDMFSLRWLVQCHVNLTSMKIISFGKISQLGSWCFPSQLPSMVRWQLRQGRYPEQMYPGAEQPASPEGKGFEGADMKCGVSVGCKCWRELRRKR